MSEDENNLNESMKEAIKKNTMQSDAQRSYSIEDILEMLGGHQYYDDNTVRFIFYKLNGNKIEADHYLNLCLEKAARIHEIETKMKDADELPILNDINDNEYTKEEKAYLNKLDEDEFNQKSEEEIKRINEIRELNKTLMYDDNDEDEDYKEELNEIEK